MLATAVLATTRCRRLLLSRCHLLFRPMDTAVPFQPWALLADSSSGSTWVNHVLSSHPCAVSQGEYLMTNKTARKTLPPITGGHRRRCCVMWPRAIATRSRDAAPI